MKRSLVYGVVVAVAVCTGAAIALAGEVSGSNIVVPKESTSSELASGMTYMTIGNSQVCVMDPADHTLNGASGDCDGACLVDDKGAGDCMGSCTWVDRDGDLAFFAWKGQTEGKWKMLGGTGKWANASGSGTWKTGAPFAGGMGNNLWKGTIDME